uniref:PNPLA domain-containing protein n=1 Tax=Eutreptiella gymnastica TaxID=73025 RepID=A0A7S4GFZ6_9EUGL|mmetsp:Transcript_78740/g.131461  ORF Transcript_78740/g.131461 Transcript_78740/m.131461 type:complete len:687 (-) Transcript_78740:3091-5151(-)
MMALVAHVQNGVKAVASCIVRVVVSILSIVIERICSFHAPANNLRRRLIKALLTCEKYQEWLQIAERLDHLSGFEEWRVCHESEHYNWKEIRRRIRDLRALRHAANGPGIAHVLPQEMHRNVGGICNPELFQYYTGTKRLIDDYYQEVHQCSDVILKDETIPLRDKYLLFKRMSQSYGRTALLLSGGAAFGTYHIGVVKAFWEAGLLPRVMTGSSAGAIIASRFCTVTDDVIEEWFAEANSTGEIPPCLNVEPFDPIEDPRMGRRIFWRFLWTGALMDSAKLQAGIREKLGDITFREAYDLTGRVLCIPVCSTREGSTTLFLSYVTTPDVLIWTGVAASCCLRGLFEPVELLCKTDTGAFVPYCPSRQKWSDGSINSDLPIKRIRELFNISCLIVSQTNPHVLPFIKRPLTAHIYAQGKPPSMARALVGRWYHFVCGELARTILMGFRIGLLGKRCRVLHNLLDQRYTGDITILPSVQATEILGLVQNPSPNYLVYCMTQAQRLTWPHLCQIACQLRIEHLMELCIDISIIQLMEKFPENRHLDGGCVQMPLRCAQLPALELPAPAPLELGCVQERFPEPTRSLEELEQAQHRYIVDLRKASRHVVEQLHTFHPRCPPMRRSMRSRGRRPSPIGERSLITLQPSLSSPQSREVSDWGTASDPSTPLQHVGDRGSVPTRSSLHCRRS